MNITTEEFYKMVAVIRKSKTIAIKRMTAELEQMYKEAEDAIDSAEARKEMEMAKRAEAIRKRRETNPFYGRSKEEIAKYNAIHPETKSTPE